MTTPNARYFALDRDTDTSGVSGTGRVAYAIDLGARPGGLGVLLVWNDKFETLDWRASMETLTDIHGHNGATRMTELDPADETDAEAIKRAKILARRYSVLAHTATAVGAVLR